jgi:NAD(P)-dependent dehydrogenase (short-subunit alcohol dehydrogenase family)
MARVFSNKVVFITGAAHGQGRAVALAFARAGAAVAGFDIARSLAYPAYPLGSSAELDELGAEIAGFGGRFLPLVGDVRDESTLAAAVAKSAADRSAPRRLRERSRGAQAALTSCDRRQPAERDQPNQTRRHLGAPDPGARGSARPRAADSGIT